MTNKLLTQKEIEYGKNENELQKIQLSGKLPYISKNNENDLHRPAKLTFMNVNNNEYIDTHTMSINLLMMYGNEISDEIIMTSPNELAFKNAMKLNKSVSLNNAAITLGDLMQMLNDEYLYRKFHEMI